MASLKNLLNSGTQTITEQGEVTVNINLVLTIKVDQDGNVNVMQQEALPTTTKKIQPESTMLELPDLGEPEEIINFGKEM